MSWLNLNQSFNSLKGQITNFASEVLSEVPGQEDPVVASATDSLAREFEDKCRRQELEIASLKKLNEELQASLHSERLSKKNGIKDEESSWYWDPPSQPSNMDNNVENQYKVQIRALQDEISNMKERQNIDLRSDTGDELDRLREENHNLTANLEDLDNQHQIAMERLLSLKKELQKNFEVLKQEHEDLKNTNDEYSNEIKNLLAKIGERDNEIENLKTVKADYDTLYHKYHNLERIHGLLRENAEKFQEENQDLHEEVFKLQEQVTKLEHEIEVATKHSELSDMVPRERYEELLKELNDLKDRRNSNQIHLDEINIDDNAKSVIENLKRDINELRHKLTQKDSNIDADHKIVRAEKILQLYNKYVNFELPVDYLGEIPSSGDIALFKLETVFKSVNAFKKEIDTLEHKLSEKNLNINHLQTQIDDLTTENDFLTTDIQHFESELNEMKKNNDFLISEIAALKNTSKLEPIIETHEDNLAKLETELADCNKINKSFESEIQRIEKELSEVKSEKNILQESLSDLKSKYTLMLKELEVCKSQTKAFEELESSTQTQRYEKLKKAEEEMADLKKRLNAANTKNEQLSIDIHIIENDKVLLTKQVDDLQHALDEKSTAHKDLELLKAALDQKLQDFEFKLDEVIKGKIDIENEKVILEKRVQELENKLSSKAITNTAESELEKTISQKNELLEKNNKITEVNLTLKDTLEKLNSEAIKLQQQLQNISAENEILKNRSKVELEANLSSQQKITELTSKLTEQDVTAILKLREENDKLLEEKLQLETQLSSTDSKITHLEQEFEKLIADLNEKDTLIDILNSTNTQNNATVSKLTETVNNLEKSLLLKNDEIQKIKVELEDKSGKFYETYTKSNQTQEELHRLHIEKEELTKQIYALNDEVSSKNSELSLLNNKLEDAEKVGREHKTIIDDKDKEIKELNQSIVEMTDKIKIMDSTTLQNDEYAKLVQEKETIQNEYVETKNSLTLKEKELVESRLKLDQLEKTCLEYKSVLENTTVEKTELINLINLKHNESIQYHNEIQRLNQVILEQSNEFKRILEEKDKLVQNQSESCSSCEILKMTLKEKDEIIIGLNKISSDYESIKLELLNCNETVRSLTERCENLDKSLTIQLDAVKKLTAENMQLSEQEQNSTRELERLRHHLVEMEENYTQDLMNSELKLTECQTRLHQVEERAKQTSTVYTSNSIRANQEVETLRNQIKLLEKQREDIQSKLSEAEDARSRSEAALINLQVVLEQFQLDKERDIQSATEKIRNKMENLKRQNNDLQTEIAKLNSKLEESLAGLQAATRLGDQVETKSAQINDLKEQVRSLQKSVEAAEERYYHTISNQHDKADKSLVKNLLTNYIIAAGQNNHNKTQVLRVLTTVLDFNQQESEKIGLGKSAPTDSLAAEFVKFLENESKPRASLPNMMGIAQSTSRSTTPTSRKNSTLGPHPIFEIGHKRNTSTGSNNLLFQNIDNIDSASQQSDTRETRVVTASLDTGVNQTRNTEGAILKSVLKDM